MKPLTMSAKMESHLRRFSAWDVDIRAALAEIDAQRARVRELEAFVRDVCAPGCAAGWATFPAVVVPPCGSCLYCRARALLPDTDTEGT